MWHCQDLTLWPQQGTTLRSQPSFRTPLKVGWSLVVTVLQPALSLCPVLLPSLSSTGPESIYLWRSIKHPSRMTQPVGVIQLFHLPPHYWHNGFTNRKDIITRRKAIHGPNIISSHSPRLIELVLWPSYQPANNKNHYWDPSPHSPSKTPATWWKGDHIGLLLPWMGWSLNLKWRDTYSVGFSFLPAEFQLPWLSKGLYYIWYASMIPHILLHSTKEPTV